MSAARGARDGSRWGWRVARGGRARRRRPAWADGEEVARVYAPGPRRVGAALRVFKGGGASHASSRRCAPRWRWAANSRANGASAALSSYRHMRTSSTQWGAWAEVGMAARARRSRWREETASGFGPSAAQGLGALHAAVLPQASSLVGVVPAGGRMLRDGAVPAFLSSMAAPAVAQGSVRRSAACGVRCNLVGRCSRWCDARRAAPSTWCAADGGGRRPPAVELHNQLQVPSATASRYRARSCLITRRRVKWQHLRGTR